MSDKIKANSYVLVHLNNRKSWLIKVRKNDQLHTHSGFIDHNDIIGKYYFSGSLLLLKEKIYYCLNQ